MLLDHDGIAVNQSADDGATPLSAAAQKGHVEVVKALVDAGAAVNHADVCSSARACWSHVALVSTNCV